MTGPWPYKYTALPMGHNTIADSNTQSLFRRLKREPLHNRVSKTDTVFSVNEQHDPPACHSVEEIIASTSRQYRSFGRLSPTQSLFVLLFIFDLESQKHELTSDQYNAAQIVLLLLFYNKSENKLKGYKTTLPLQYCSLFKLYYSMCSMMLYLHLTYITTHF